MYIYNIHIFQSIDASVDLSFFFLSSFFNASNMNEDLQSNINKLRNGSRQSKRKKIRKFIVNVGKTTKIRPAPPHLIRSLKAQKQTLTWIYH